MNSTTSYGYKTHDAGSGRLRETVNNACRITSAELTIFCAAARPALDATNPAALPGPAIGLSALEVYRRTLLFEQEGLNDPAIRQLGGGAYEFSLTAGRPTIAVNLLDAGLYFAESPFFPVPTLSFSYGLRYEIQNTGFPTGTILRFCGSGVGNTDRRPTGEDSPRMGAFYSRIPLNPTLLNGDAA